MRVVTAGKLYLDIDSYAGIVAYAELLQKQGIEAVAATTAPLNESITSTIRSWEPPILTTYTPSPVDTYVLVDISNPDYFDTFVDVARVTEVIDHHPGFESYWQERVGAGAHIEFIGAACTQVYELWKSSGKFEEMSTLSARLLICGILDNTFNFGAKITHERDRVAYADLLTKANLPEDWTAQYFTECQRGILGDVPAALKADTKYLDFRTFPSTLVVGQLVVWDASQIVSTRLEVMQSVLATMGDVWFINVVSIREGKSYFIADKVDIQHWLAGLLTVVFNGSVASAGRMWLRKEIIKQDILVSENKQKS